MGQSKLVEDAKGIKEALKACLDFPIRTWLAQGEMSDIQKTWTANKFADTFPLEVFIDPNAGKNATAQAGKNTGTKFSTTQVKGYNLGGSDLDTASGFVTAAAKSAIKSGASSATKVQSGVVGGAAAGGTAAIGPALIAAEFIWERSYTYGFKDLYSLVSNGGAAADLFPCNCSKGKSVSGDIIEPFIEDGKNQKRTVCDDAIAWIANRKYSDTALKAAIGTGAALAVAFAPAGIALTASTITAAALEQAYRTGRERWKRNHGGGPKEIEHFDTVSSFTAIGCTADGQRYFTPGKASYWVSDAHAKNCLYEGCTTKVQSRVWRLGYAGSSARHHCRVCGKIYCGEHGSAELPVLGPLSNSVKKNPPSDLTGGEVETRNLVPNQRVCVDCWGNAAAIGLETHLYITGPERAAQALIDNAKPASQGVQGCPRAQAALFCLFHGNLKHVLASLVARDGKDKVVSQTGCGVTKLPF